MDAVLKELIEYKFHPMVRSEYLLPLRQPAPVRRPRYSGERVVERKGREQKTLVRRIPTSLLEQVQSFVNDRFHKPLKVIESKPEAFFTTITIHQDKVTSLGREVDNHLRQNAQPLVLVTDTEKGVHIRRSMEVSNLAHMIGQYASFYADLNCKPTLSAYFGRIEYDGGIPLAPMYYNDRHCSSKFFPALDQRMRSGYLRYNVKQYRIASVLTPQGEYEAKFSVEGQKLLVIKRKPIEPLEFRIKRNSQDYAIRFQVACRSVPESAKQMFSTPSEPRLVIERKYINPKKAYCMKYKKITEIDKTTTVWVYFKLSNLSPSTISDFLSEMHALAN